MEKQAYKDIFYSLNIEDIQNVSQEEIDRNLSDVEIANIKELIASKINWYDAIAEAIQERVEI